MQSKRKGLCIYVSFKAILNCPFSFLRLVCETSGKLLKIPMPAHNVSFGKHESRAWGLWKWCLLLVLIVCTDELFWHFSSLWTLKFINENVFWEGTGKISYFLNRLLCGGLGRSQYRSLFKNNLVRYFHILMILIRVTEIIFTCCAYFGIRFKWSWEYVWIVDLERDQFKAVVKIHILY
jgi:hypothetical protein